MDSQDMDFLKGGNEALQHCWQKCTDIDVDKVEKMIQYATKSQIFTNEAHKFSVSPFRLEIKQYLIRRNQCLLTMLIFYPCCIHQMFILNATHYDYPNYHQ